MRTTGDAVRVIAYEHVSVLSHSFRVCGERRTDPTVRVPTRCADCRERALSCLRRTSTCSTGLPVFYLVRGLRTLLERTQNMTTPCVFTSAELKERRDVMERARIIGHVLRSYARTVPSKAYYLSFLLQPQCTSILIRTLSSFAQTLPHGLERHEWYWCPSRFLLTMSLRAQHASLLHIDDKRTRRAFSGLLCSSMSSGNCPLRTSSAR